MPVEEIVITDDVDLSCFLGANARVRLTVTDEALEVALSGNAAEVSLITTGVVESVQSRNIYAAHTLRIENVYVTEETFVEADQVLTVLNVADLESEVGRLRINLEQAKKSSEIATKDTRRILAEAALTAKHNTVLSRRKKL